MSLSVDEINILVRRYLEESGFPHTAYIFQAESMQPTNLIDTNLFPPNAFITILKKGMFYIQMEKAITAKAQSITDQGELVESIITATRNHEAISTGERPVPIQPEIPPPAARPIEPISLSRDSAILLEGHKAVVYKCEWSPNTPILATGSEDATAIIWDMTQSPYTKRVLDCATIPMSDRMTISSLCWSHNGEILATGCMDGTVRMYNTQGDLRFIMQRHLGAIYSMQFSPDDTMLLTGGQDHRVIVWSTQTGEAKLLIQREGVIFEVRWFDSSIFAACMGDGHIVVIRCNGELVGVLDGHHGTVNSIEWSYTGRAIASCSDDKTVKVWWPLDSGRSISLIGHTEPVYVIRWFPGDSSLLASGAFDHTIRIWDVHKKTCVYCITRHQQPIYSISFSPNGSYFVTGGRDKYLCIWKTSDFSLVGSYMAQSEIYDAQWDSESNYIALALNDSTVAVLPTSTLYLLQE